MFGRKKQEQPEGPQGRYHVEAVHTLRSQETFTRDIAQAMNEGDAKGWRLINVTQHAATVLLYWDTQTNR